MWTGQDLSLSYIVGCPQPVVGQETGFRNGEMHEMARASNRINEELEEAKTRKTTYEADIKQMQLAQAAGNLIPKEEVVETWSEWVSFLGPKLLAIPTKLTPLVKHEDDPKKIKEIADTFIHEVLNELASYDPDQIGKGTGRDKRSGKASNSAPKTNRKSVGRPRTETKLRS